MGQGASLGSFPLKVCRETVASGKQKHGGLTVQPRWGRKEQDWWMDEMGEFTGQIRV